ncbi:MAG: tryptophanase [Planctomycetota bacterium]|nr:tryptophanase [Planctomycetota bacterium]
MSKLPIIEPFRIKSVEPIRMTTRPEREALLAEAKNNLFFLHSQDVIIDLLTDSGTGAMSAEQWAAIMRGDESYAGSPSFGRFEDSVHDVMGFEEVIPTHQGRAAEHLLFSIFGGPGKVILNNTHFDTTRANAEVSGAKAIDLSCLESGDTASLFPFKGNMDLARLEAALLEHGDAVTLVMVTMTNNAGGGQPVSLENLRGVRELCDRFDKPLYLDACRFAENAYFIQQREEGQADREVRELVKQVFAMADGCTMSAKKDGMANIGGFLACRDKQLADEFRRRLVVTEGFPTYGGLAGRDLEAVAQGLQEVVREDYLAYRAASIRYVVERLHERGIPVLRPPGGHAIFLDAARFLDHLPWQQYPGHALALELYLEGGIRACEIGSVMLGHVDPETGIESPAHHELVRLAIPRRTYTQSHMDFCIEIIDAVFRRRAAIGGVTIETSPPVLRHFGATFGRSAVGAVTAS